MSTAAAPPSDAPALRPHAPGAAPTTLYFTIAIALCALGLSAPMLAVFGVLPGRPDQWMAGAPLAAFSPTIAAVIASWREGGWPQVRALFRGLKAWRAGPIWYVLAIALPSVVFLAGRAIYALLPAGDGGAWFYLPERPEHFAGILVIPIAEEIGWRGYALPRLIARRGAPVATGILSVLWAVWHIPMFIAAGSTASQVLLCMAFIAVGTPVFTWHYRRSGGSLLLAWLFHVGAHLCGMTHALPGNATPVVIAVVAYTVLSLSLFVFDRGAFQGKTPEAPGTRPALG